MSPPFRSAVALRNDICFNIDELQQRNTSELPDGATVRVTGIDALYVLEKGAGPGFDGIGRPMVVQPSNQSGDRWFQALANGASPWQATEIATAAVNVTPGGQFQWQALGSTPGAFDLANGDGDAFQVNLTNSLLIYNGPPRLFTITYQVSVLAGAAATFDCQVAIGVSGDISVGNTSDQRTKGQQSSTISNSVQQCISGQRTQLLGADDTVRLYLRNMTGAQVIEVDYFSINLRP